MPRQNRVTPTGDLIVTTARGTLMGNRGCLHDDGGQIRRRHQGRRWIYCRLEFRGRRRVVMTPGRYTELFFLDEVTALAAGHRPCAECLRLRFDLFRTCWTAAGITPTPRPPSAEEIDRVLHEERLTCEWGQDIGCLPVGVFVLLESESVPCLLTHDGLRFWTSEGYSRRPGAAPERFSILTPTATVRVLAQGYHCESHPSAFGL